VIKARALKKPEINSGLLALIGIIEKALHDCLYSSLVSIPNRRLYFSTIVSVMRRDLLNDALYICLDDGIIAS